MHRAYSFGGAPFIKKYQISEAMATAGVPVLAETLSDVYGLVLASTTGAADMVGVTLDAQPTLLTAQQSDGSDPSRYVSVDINPHAVWHADISGGSTSGTALSTVTNSSASTDGLTLTASIAADPYDDGYAWGAAGNNVGKASLRKMTAVSGSAATFVVAQRYDIAVGDTYYLITFGPGEESGVQLTTTLDEIDATAEEQTGNNFRCVDLHLFDSHQQDVGGSRSWAELVPCSHLFGAGKLA